MAPYRYRARAEANGRIAAIALIERSGGEKDRPERNAIGRRTWLHDGQQLEAVSPLLPGKDRTVDCKTINAARSTPIRRRRRRNHFQRDESEHRVNRDIRISPVRVIDPDGEQIGVMSADEARDQAAEFGLDLVEVAPKARPPVCRIMDYGKFKYEQSKKQSNNSNKVELKTIQFRPNTGDHDMDTKLGHAERFLDDGNKVKLVIRIRGRERAYTERWVDFMNDVIERLDEEHEDGVRVLNHPRSEGRQITAIIEADNS